MPPAFLEAPYAVAEWNGYSVVTACRAAVASKLKESEMDPHRTERVSEALREELTEMIAYELSDPRVSEAIVSALILPYVATSFNAEEQADVLNRAKDTDGALATTLRRLRKRLT